MQYLLKISKREYARLKDSCQLQYNEEYKTSFINVEYNRETGLSPELKPNNADNII